MLKLKMNTSNEKDSIKRSNTLSSGSTLLNLALTNTPYGAFQKGKYVFFVGDSSSGKTFLSMSCFAEATINPEFSNYKLIYDNVEDGCLIDLEKIFNKQVAEKIQPPNSEKNGTPKYSSTIEEFYYNLDDAILEAKKTKTPFIYILDSMDGLDSDSANEKFEKQKEAHRKGNSTAGSFGDGKAKKNSEGLRKAMKGLRTTGSILIIICQTRDNLGIGFEQKTRSGGRALKFYATHEIWTSLAGKIKKRIKGKDRTIGIHVKVQVKKNRVIGDTHETTIDIYPSYGIDDIGGCIDFLVDEGVWSKSGRMIKIPGLVKSQEEMRRETIIDWVESSPKNYRKLQKLVAECWHDIVHECTLNNRKKKYGGIIE